MSRPTPVTGTGKCPKCGTRLTLALDETRYLGVVRISAGTGETVAECYHETSEVSEARLFCAGCETEYEPPANWQY